MLWEAQDMATLQELYRLKDDPDLTHWKTVKLFTLSEASLLTVGIDPLEYSHLSDDPLKDELRINRPINWQHALLLMRSLTESICTHEVKSPFINLERSDDYGNTWDFVEEQTKISIDNASEIVLTSTKIHRDELFKWLKKYGYFEPPQQNTITVETQSATYQQSESVQHNNMVLLPEPTYTTPPLEALHGVINEFWVNYDPDKNQPPPKQDVVASWIMANYPEVQGKELCIYIDKICRHPTAKKGGNTKLNPQNKTKDTTPIK